MCGDLSGIGELLVESLEVVRKATVHYTAPCHRTPKAVAVAALDASYEEFYQVNPHPLRPRKDGRAVYTLSNGIYLTRDVGEPSRAPAEPAVIQNHHQCGLFTPPIVTKYMLTTV